MFVAVGMYSSTTSTTNRDNDSVSKFGRYGWHATTAPFGLAGNFHKICYIIDSYCVKYSSDTSNTFIKLIRTCGTISFTYMPPRAHPTHFNIFTGTPLVLFLWLFCTPFVPPPKIVELSTTSAAKKSKN